MSISINKNRKEMKTFKINFEDQEGNVIYSKVDTFLDEKDAVNYADKKIANTNDDCVSFEIYEVSIKNK